MTIHIDGINPEPWQAPLGSVARRKGGGQFVRMSTPPKQMAYQTAIREAIDMAYPEYAAETDHPYPFDKGQSLSIKYWFWRKLDKYQTANTGRNMTANRVDLTNLVKATEDCLQGRLIWNDVEVVHEEAYMVNQGIDVDPHIMIIIENIEMFKSIIPGEVMIGAPNPPGNCMIRFKS